MYKLDDEVLFMTGNEIQFGIISQITITRSGAIYEIEYQNEENEIMQTELHDKYLYNNIDDLLDDLKNKFYNLKEI